MSFLVDLAPKFSEVMLFALIGVTVSLGLVFAIYSYRKLDAYEKVLCLQWSLFVGLLAGFCFGVLAFKSLDYTQQTTVSIPR